MMHFVLRVFYHKKEIDHHVCVSTVALQIGASVPSF